MTNYTSRSHYKSAVMSRRTLQVLQPSASDQMLLVGSGGMIKLGNQKAGQTKQPGKVTDKNGMGCDENSCLPHDLKHSVSKEMRSKRQTYADKEIQTDTRDLDEVDRCIEELTSEEAPLSYWKEIAERRRIALEEALDENKKLHEEIEVLEHDNKQLREISKEAERLALILESLTSDSLESGAAENNP